MRQFIIIEFLKWTKCDRAFSMIISLIGGPISASFILVLFLLKFIKKLLSKLLSRCKNEISEDEAPW